MFINTYFEYLDKDGRVLQPVPDKLESNNTPIEFYGAIDHFTLRFNKKGQPYIIATVKTDLKETK